MYSEYFTCGWIWTILDNRISLFFYVWTILLVFSFGVVDLQWHVKLLFSDRCYSDVGVAKYFAGIIFEGWFWKLPKFLDEYPKVLSTNYKFLQCCQHRLDHPQTQQICGLFLGRNKTNKFRSGVKPVPYGHSCWVTLCHTFI